MWVSYDEKVFVFYIVDDETRKPVRGVIQDINCTVSWYLSGEYEQEEEEKSCLDIISKWED